MQETSPKIFCNIERDFTACHNVNADGLSGHGLMRSLGDGKDRSFNNIMGNWVNELHKHCV